MTGMNGLQDIDKNYEVIRKHGKKVVIMEPVKGGVLAQIPEGAKKKLRSLEPEISPAVWALRFAGSMEDVIKTSIFATVVCRVFFSVLFGIWLDMGVIGICIAMVGDWFVKALLIMTRYRSLKWTGFQVID